MSTSHFFQSFIRSIKHYNLTIFIVLIASGLSVSVILLKNAIDRANPEQSQYQSVIDNSSFDQTTVNRINQLRTSTENTSAAELPAGRVNPFGE